ncbi:MAG: RIP metalloprotease RseP [Candidatus Marinimicrobia bacterium]|nr:RIP metalloprotease RseP [Candidatus Neomarinimicrobiota bacterium]|tara:strand:- start:110 stop:1279 length:1170 start_codon:yes stop_codon:yes gene_type:complete
MTFLWATILVLGVLIFVHELGHFFAARSCGVKVERFSIGFPPRFFSITSVDNGFIINLFFFKLVDKKLKWSPIIKRFIKISDRKGSGTEYVVAIIPFGGYVKMAGFIDESMDTNIQYEANEFMSKTAPSKIFILSAGVLMNILTAFLIFSGISYVQGEFTPSEKPIIYELIKDMPAKNAGLKSGDKIIRINDNSINTWKDLTNIIHSRPNSSINVSILRGEKELEFLLKTSSTPIINNGEIDSIGVIGIRPEFLHSDISFSQSLSFGLSGTIGGFGMIFMSMKMLFNGAASLSDFGGPIMIAQIAGNQAEAGIIPLLSFMGLISINLAFLNILPIPGLDGGHIFIILIESIIKRSLALKTRILIQQVGMTFLLLLMVTVMYNDISRLFN